MIDKQVCGLFVTGTDTGVGKTHVAAMIARWLHQQGRRVGVYKPVASGCRREGDTWVCDDAARLWEAAGRPLSLEQVCPQMFAAPLAPHLAARAEGREVDAALLRSGLEPWRQISDVIVVEGAGGLMSPASADDYVADLAEEFGFPLVVVARNALGTIHQTLSTLIVAHTFRDGLPVAGVVLNQADAQPDASAASNAAELRQRAVAPLLAEVSWDQRHFQPPIDWFALASASLPAQG